MHLNLSLFMLKKIHLNVGGFFLVERLFIQQPLQIQFQFRFRYQNQSLL